ncbi:MAG: hypothetical protein M3N41_08600, partial [Acidobacteriota bacterium]|nr:hypothetical protein [Acidobacteriota bacterium]
HKFAGDDDHDSGYYWAKLIGYAKIGTRWGIALRKSSGNLDAPPEFQSEEEWLFNDAPRQLRMEAVDYIPEMINDLINSAEKAVEKIQIKTAEARKLAEVLAPPPTSAFQRKLREAQEPKK